MSESLGAKQKRFAKMLPRLIDKAHELGFEVSIGDVFRDPRVHGIFGVKKGYSAAKSVHKLKLAVDINLFWNGVLVRDTKGHQQLGEWWESQGGSWGGRFNDGNHYSLEHEGCR